MPDPHMGSASPRALPAGASLEHLKNQAKQRLPAMRRETPDAKLADAQFRLAREYGFASWRALKAEVERRAPGAAPPGPLGRYVGFYRYDPALLTNAVLTVTQDQGRLSAQVTGAPAFDLIDEGGGVFQHIGLSVKYVFETAGAGPASHVDLSRDGADVRLTRVNAAAARRAQAGFARDLTAQSQSRTAIEVDPRVLDRYVGHYSTRVGPALEVTRDGGRLLARVTAQPAYEIHPETETDFFWRATAAQLSFVVENDRASAVVLHQSGRDERLPRVSAEEAQQAGARVERKFAEQVRPRRLVKVGADVLAGYAGRYQLDLQRILTVTVEQDRIFIEITDQQRFEVYPESDRDFFWTVAAAQITFFTERAGWATHAVLHQSGRDFPLARVETAAA